MAKRKTQRKSHDVVLPEVRKPADYGQLINVVGVDENRRELWFQHQEAPDIVRCVTLDVSTSKVIGKPLTIATKATREPMGFRL